MILKEPIGWSNYLKAFPDHHFLQSALWGQLKREFGWDVFWVVNQNSGCQVLFRRLPLGYTIAYIPKGPVGPHSDALQAEIDGLCRKHKAIYLMVEPDRLEQKTDPSNALVQGFTGTHETVQPRRTIILDLTKEEEVLLAEMKQKTRYNINLAVKKGVVVAPSEDLAAFSTMMKVTGGRDNFGIHNQAYYASAYSKFHPAGKCELLMAFYDQVPLAAIMVFFQGSRAWYVYGASSNVERNRMPTYVVQWEAMKLAKRKGCKSYDLWGVPDCDPDILESQFETRSDGLWGVYRFKRGFGGTIVRSVETLIRVYHPLLYKVVHWLRKRSGETA